MTDNLYRGVNPHLNSLLQIPGTDDQSSLWPQFHAAHVNHIADLLNQVLPAHYVAYSEQSLQVRGVEWGESISLERPRPDVSVFQHSSPSVSAVSSLAPAPTWEAAIAESIEPLRRPVAVVIRARDKTSPIGTIVMRIELLSPSNKLRGSHFVAYLQKRLEALESGIPLVEIDYLHESPIVLHGHPIYPHDEGSYPYTIAVSDPRPSWEEGRVKVYGASVDSALPVVPLPLDDAERLDFDFDAVYQYTFRARRYHTLIDYAREPVRFETYSVSDQARIHQKMTEFLSKC